SSLLCPSLPFSVPSTPVSFALSIYLDTHTHTHTHTHIYLHVCICGGWRAYVVLRGPQVISLTILNKSLGCHGHTGGHPLTHPPPPPPPPAPPSVLSALC